MSRQILVFILSLGASFVVTWAGIHYDNALLYVGVGLIALVVILFGHSWAFPKPLPVQYVQGAPEPEAKDEKDRALQALKKARDNALIAAHQGSQMQAESAVHQMRAALLSIQKQFGTPAFKVAGNGSYKDMAQYLVRYVDTFYPLLREGHISAGIKAAGKWPD